MPSQDHTRRLLPAAVLLAAIFAAGSARAQLGMGGGAGGGQGSYILEEGERNLKFAGIPVPGYSEVLGANLGLVGMAFYKMDRDDETLPPSSTGIFGFYSENNSWIGAAFQQFYLDGDRWRLMAAGGTGSVKYQFDPASVGPGFPDGFIDYTTATGFLFLQGQRQTWNDLYLGLAAVSWSAEVSADADVPSTSAERYTGPGVVADWDKRNDVMTPTDGYAVSGRMIFYDDSFGSDANFQALSLAVSSYRELSGPERVLAGRFMYESAYGDVPFSAETIVNGNRNLRGYANGSHRADQLLMVETEYRWNFYHRWGAVVFAGLAWSADEVSQMTLADTLPGSGIGLRFRMIDAYRINARIDYGWGKDDQAVYFSIGEAY